MRKLNPKETVSHVQDLQVLTTIERHDEEVSALMKDLEDGKVSMSRLLYELVVMRKVLAELGLVPLKGEVR